LRCVDIWAASYLAIHQAVKQVQQGFWLQRLRSRNRAGFVGDLQPD
jgi:hypothetical protein